MAFVADEGVLAVEFMPGEVHVQFAERVVDLLPTFERHVRVLFAPEHEQFAFDVLGADERVVAGFAERTFVDVRGVIADRREHIRVFCRGAKAEVTADANTQRAEFTGAGGM